MQRPECVFVLEYKFLAKYMPNKTAYITRETIKCQMTHTDYLGNKVVPYYQWGTDTQKHQLISRTLSYDLMIDSDSQCRKNIYGMFNFILWFYFCPRTDKHLAVFSQCTSDSHYTYLDQFIIYLLPGIVYLISGVTHMETCSKFTFTNGKIVACKYTMRFC